MLTAGQIRRDFIDFFKSKGHEFVPSSPIVPIGDDTLLFANAGMNQFKDIFLGLSDPQYPRVANSQKCVRAGGKHNDLEDVGADTYHHTFFEMLGNWSFGNYFKAEAIEWAWELITKKWGIKPDKLYATVFAGDKSDSLEFDKESAELWPRVTSLPRQRVLAFGRKDNFWEMGDIGPCGPCSEIHIDLGPDRCDKKNIPGHKCAVNAGCSRFIELWNLVFIQYNRLEDGRVLPLPAKHVDTGMGLERITAVLQNKSSNYDTDLFTPILDKISGLCGQKYSGTLDKQTDIALRVIADHLRCLVFAITDGCMPSNDGRGYVLRRILRRASRFGRVLNLHDPFIFNLVPTVVNLMGDFYGELRSKQELVQTVLESEEAGFGRTLDRGLEIFNTAAEKAESSKNKTISGEDAFELYDTYGFPLDLTQLMAREKNLKVDTTGFDNLMDKQRQRARAAQKTSSFTSLAANTKLPVTDDSPKYKSDRCASGVSGWIVSDGKYISSGKLKASDGEVGLVLEKTCFYAESGGQVGDIGEIKGRDGHFIVESTEKIGDCIVHRGKTNSGTFTVNEQVEAIVDNDRRATMKNHTATHLLQWALQQTLGSSVAQQGSLVCSEYLRFDFTCPRALTDDQIKKVEGLVREKIAADYPVTCSVLPREQAQKLGAMALFGEKYGSEVRVIAIGTDDETRLADAFSKEFCGGTHVDRLGSIGGFKIIKEESISSGVRRITALTGEKLNEFLEKRSEIVESLCETLKVSADDLVAKVSKLVDENKKLAKQLKSASKQTAVDVMAEAKQLLDKSEKIGSVSVIIGRLSAVSVEQGREAVDMLKKKAKSAVVVIGFADDENATLLAGVTDDLVKNGLNAGDIIKQIAPLIDGGGGGRPQMAQAGGKKPEKIDVALAKAAEIIKEKLGSAK
ncbi:MAG: alanine--tRNA ligase [Phycisphaerae bacterium]|nr:alanine--tRNA ligase [Phycisphaerae bacterium]MDD5380405.1 alanine--tRNA ligase [Phycisphaerae bacterium]